MTTASRPGWLLSLLALALIFAAFMLGGRLVDPPPLRANADPLRFDAVAARERLARILGDETPHPIDGDAQDAVRARLLAEIEAIGLTPEVRESFSCVPQPRGPTVDCALVRNIFFSIGPESGPAVMAATHYDSVPAAPGASDAGIGIAVWLEIARMLANSEPERRIVFFISDGEEVALLGAAAFAANDPLMDDVEALVNLEARGSRGPAIFFETNPPNGDSLAAYAHAPRPVANSIMADAYRLMPNSTDVAVMTRPGLDVVNIALLDGIEDYHTPNDNIASQDPRSVQQMGDAALETVRAFASRTDRGGAENIVYTDLASRVLIAAPAIVAQGAVALVGLLAFFLFWREGKAGRWRAFGAPPLALAIAALLATGAGFALAFARGGDYAFAYPEFTRAWCALFGVFGFVAALMLTRTRNVAQTEAAAVFWIALLGTLFAFVTPGISILFALPLAAYAIGALVGFAWKPARLIGAVLALLVALLIWAPALYLTELALGFDLPFVFALLIALVTLLGAGLVLRLQGETRWRLVAGVVGVSALIALSAAALAPSASLARPAPLNINTVVDTDSGETRLTAGGAARRLPPEIAAASTFAPDMALPGDRFPSWVAPAESEALAAPVLADVSVVEQADVRIVRGRFVANGAYRITLRIPRAARPMSATLNGVVSSFADVGDVTDYVNLACQGRACDGAVFEIRLEGGGDASDWFLIGQTPGAESPAAASVRAARPPTTVPIQNGDTTFTLSRVRLAE